ncbi:MAG: DUF2493 domain-containing protein [Clostridia bacterium]|nr:DUF2493 domain-containing protein [Clostridia bacterium]
MIKRIVVAGSRNFNEYSVAKKYIDACIKDLKNSCTFIFVSGTCKGADLLGEKYAIENGFEIERYPAQWNIYGRGAGIRRNEQMAQVSDIVICFWDGKSKGTKSMIELAKKNNKTIYIKLVETL